MAAAGKDLKYSKAIEELEEIVEQIEGESVDVDTLAEKVKRASFLIEFCRGKLKETETEVRKVLSGMKGVDPASGDSNPTTGDSNSIDTPDGAPGRKKGQPQRGGSDDSSLF